MTNHSFSKVCIPVVVFLFIFVTEFSKPIHNKLNQAQSFAVTRTGKGKPMILIPGLYCSGKVLDEIVKHFKNQSTCYEITFPGFGGQPPIRSDSIMKTVARQLAFLLSAIN